jgi:hypothetical protein
MENGNGEVPRERCSYCHAEVGRLEQYSQTQKIHQIHITEHKVECNHCHNNILHRSTARSDDIKPDCRGCHTDRHLAQFNLFSGQGAKGVDPMPSSMFEAGLSCKACHNILPSDWKKHPDISTTKAGPSSCKPCHDEKYYNLYKQAKPIIQQKVSSAQDRIDNLKSELKGKKANKVIADCQENLSLIQKGQPIHNLDYSDKIIYEINRSLDLLEGKEVSPRSELDAETSECLKCHYGQDEAVVQYHNKKFSHRLHLYGNNLKCTNCHQTEKPNHGKLKSGEFCLNCHHKTAAVSCEPCHTQQRDLYEAKGAFLGLEPDPMFTAEVVCRDCHEVVGKKVMRPNSETCEMCHEPGYWEKLVDSRNKTKLEISQLEGDFENATASREQQQALEILKILQAEGTGGAHNIKATEKILEMKSKLINSQ